MGGAEVAKAIPLGALYLAAGVYTIYDPETVVRWPVMVWSRAVTDEDTGVRAIRFAGCAMLALPLAVLSWMVWWPLGIAVGVGGATGLYYAASQKWPL